MSVRQRIRDRLEQGGDLAPAKVASDVLKALRDDELRDALAVALPYLVRDESRKQRHKAIGKPPTTNEADPAYRPSDIEAWKDRAERRQQASRAGATKAAKIRERRAALLETPMSINGEWKPLGDCTADDLRAIAQGLRKDISQRRARADGFERLADELDSRGVDTVEAIDASEVREAFGAVL